MIIKKKVHGFTENRERVGKEEKILHRTEERSQWTNTKTLAASKKKNGET